MWHLPESLAGLKMWSAKLIVLILYLGLAECKYSVPTLDIDEEDRVVARKYMEMDKELKDIINGGVKRVLPMLMEASQNLNLSSKCMGNILQLTAGIRKLKLSAIQCKFINLFYISLYV